MSDRTIVVSPNTKVVLELGDDFIKRRIFPEGLIDNIFPDDLLQLLALCKEKTKINIGRIPGDTSIIEMCVIEPGDVKKVLLFVPKGRFDMRTEQVTFKNVEYPAMIFLFVITGEKISDTKIVALKGIEKKSHIKDDTMLYRYPFSHVNHNFSVCWGNVSLPSVPCLETLEIIPYAFWLNSMHSLGHNLAATNTKGKSVEEIYKALEMQELSIDECLVETGITYSQFKDEYM